MQVKNLSRALVALPFAGALTTANAAVDAAITSAISGAQTDGLAVAALVTGMCVVIWGALFLKRKFFG